MGLDTSHDCWHGPYSSFSRWRNSVTRTAGYAMNRYEEGPLRSNEYAAVLDLGSFESKNYQGKWDTTPKDPLLILIVHSDCDGHIKPKHAKLLADRLEEIMGWMPADRDIDLGHGDRALTQQFINGLRAAHAANEKVVFH